MIFRNRYRLRGLHNNNLNSLLITFRLCCCFLFFFQTSYVCQNWKIEHIKYLLIVATNDYNNNTWWLISITRIYTLEILNSWKWILNTFTFTDMQTFASKKTIFFVIIDVKSKKVLSKIQFIETCKIQVNCNFERENKTDFQNARWHIKPNQLIAKCIYFSILKESKMKIEERRKRIIHSKL